LQSPTVMTYFEPPSPIFGPPSTELPKPPVPYIPGWRFTIKSHTAPAPTPVVQDCCINSKGDKKERRQLSPIYRCLKHPPLPGIEGNDTASLEVIDVLKGGDGHNSQVFTVRLLDCESTSQMLPLKGTRLVAKAYDPLYFNDDEGYLNPFLCMDKYYTHEANAYMVLIELQDQWIPRYYGSYSLSLSVDSVHTRTVRMILVEHIQGITMADSDPRNLSQSARQSILKAIVDIESRIYEKDILLTDLEPRNIIISSPDSDQPRVVVHRFCTCSFQPQAR
jgi:serine/threonine protein kinase